MEFTSFDDLKNILGAEYTSSTYIAKANSLRGTQRFVNKR